MSIKFESKRRKRSGDSGGSMADIAFLLLIFFLVATTIFNEKGIQTTLPEWKPNALKKLVHVDKRVNIKIKDAIGSNCAATRQINLLQHLFQGE